MFFEKKPWPVAFSFFLLAFSLVHFLLFGGWGLSVLCLYAACALCWLLLSPRRSRGWFWLIMGAGGSLSFALWEQPFLAPWLAVGIPLCLVLWIGGGLPENSRQALGQMLPLHLSPAVFTLLGAGLKERQKLGRIALGIGMALPLLFFTALLLASAEEAFQNLLAGLFTGLGEELPLLLIKIILALLIALYFCCLALAVSRPVPQLSPQRAQGDALVVSVMLGLLCGLYLVFLGVSVRPLAALANPTPGLLSHYARKGFFELCAAAGMNLIVFLIVNRFEGMRKGAPRFFSLLLAGLTLLLIALAGVKMGLYIRFCGLTLLRFYTSCFMGVMALFFIGLIVSLFRPLPVMRLGAGMLALSLFVMSLFNAGGFIAASNAERYLARDLPTLDLSQYDQFPHAAAPALYRLWEETDNLRLRQMLAEFFQKQQVSSPSSLWETSQQALEAQKIFQQFHP